MDRLTKDQRSLTMSRIKSKGTSIEKIVRSVLRRNNIQYTSNPKMYGHPDMIINDKKIAIFLDGCFWHGCKKCKNTPKTNKIYWTTKISSNRERDKTISKNLRSRGWIVLRLWEHQIKPNPRLVISKLARYS